MLSFQDGFWLGFREEKTSSSGRRGRDGNMKVCMGREWSPGELARRLGQPIRRPGSEQLLSIWRGLSFSISHVARAQRGRCPGLWGSQAMQGLSPLPGARTLWFVRAPAHQNRPALPGPDIPNQMGPSPATAAWVHPACPNSAGGPLRRRKRGQLGHSAIAC